MTDSELYEDFQKSLEAREYRPIMVHKPSDVRLATLLFEEYLTKEELCVRQFVGRFWTIFQTRFDILPKTIMVYSLYILIDNDTAMLVRIEHDAISERRVFDRCSAILPDELLGRYYE